MYAVCISRLTRGLCGELLGLILSLVRSLQPVLLIGLLQSGKRYVSNNLFFSRSLRGSKEILFEYFALAVPSCVHYDV